MLKVLGRFTGGLALVALATGAGAGLAIAPLVAGPASAATTVTVNDPVDSATVAPGNCTSATEGDCTLRSAIAAFNAGTTDFTINLPNPSSITTYHTQAFYNVASGAGLGVIAVDNTNPLLALTLANTGTALGPIVASGTNIFEVDGNNSLTLSGFSLSGGSTTADGGAILNEGNLSLSNSDVFGNSAVNGGGIAVEQSSTLGAGNPTATLTDDTIAANTASADGGGVFVSASGTTTTTITGGTIGGTTGAEAAGNTAAVNGGGLAQEGAGALTLSNVTVGGTAAGQGNTAHVGGGIYVADGTNTFTGGSVENNVATSTTLVGGDGGGIAINAGTNALSGQQVADNEAQTSNTATSGAEGGGVYVNDGTAALTNESITGNTATSDATLAVTGFGGGFYTDDNHATGVDSTVTGGSIDGNHAFDGGGVYVNDGTNNFSQVDVSSNTAQEAGGGFWIEFSFVTGDVPTVTNISQSTISLNSATGTAGTGNGAGILADVDPTATSGCNALALTNDTIAGNMASNNGGGYYGTGCTAPTTEKTALLFDTVAGNTEDVSGGANIQTTDHSVLTMGQSIVAGGTPNCAIGTSSTLTSKGYNVVDDHTCGTAGTGDVVGEPAQLGTLQNNGGTTKTELPASTSPAVGLVPSATCTGTGVTTDQTGAARGKGLNGSCTAGAVEVSQTAPPPPPPPGPTSGYWMVGNDGGVFSYGNAAFHGSMGGQHLNAPIVGIAGTADGGGYWEVASDGGIFNFGDALFHGSMGGQHLNAPIVGIASTPDGGGYWEVASDGGIFSFGDAHFFGSMGGQHLNAPIVGIASTHDGLGYWEVASDGGIFAFGDAHFYGSTGSIHLNKPVVGMIATADGGGYWFVASDGGIFNYGDAAFFGSAGSLHLAQPVVGMGVAPQGGGYWLFAADGGLFNYGSASYLGSVPGSGVHVTNIVGGATT